MADPALIDPTIDMVSVNRPGTNNSLTIRMMQEITQAIDQLHDANQVRAVLLAASSDSKEPKHA